MAQGSFGGALQSDPVFMLNSPSNLVAADQRLRAAQRHYINGNYSEAVRIYNAYPDRDYMPDMHKYYYSRSLFESGSPIKAQQIIESIERQILPPTWQWQADRITAEALLASEEYDIALTMFEELLGSSVNEEDRVKILISAARTALSAGKWETAEQLFNEYLSLSRSDEADLALIEEVSLSYVDRGKYRGAIDLLRRMELLVSDPEEAMVYRFRIAALYEHINGAEAAAEEFLAIAYRNPDRDLWPAKARLKAAELYEKAGRIEMAERQYRYVAENYQGTEEALQAARRLREIARARDQLKEEQITSPVG
jgi:tetratricopeptide (TPR) repeat protein